MIVIVLGTNVFSSESTTVVIAGTNNVEGEPAILKESRPLRELNPLTLSLVIECLIGKETEHGS